MQSDAKPQGATRALALYTPRFGNELWKLTGHSSGLSRNAVMPRCDVTNVTCTDHLLSYSMCVYSSTLCTHCVYITYVTYVFCILFAIIKLNI